MREPMEPAKEACGIAVAPLIAVEIPGAASATIITFTGESLGVLDGSFPDAIAARDQFVASLSSTARGNVETFEGFPVGSLGGPPQMLALTATGSTGPLTGEVNTAVFQNQVSDASGGGRLATSGSQYYAASQAFSLAFDQPISAIGFFLTGLGDVGFDRLSLTLSGDLTTTLAVPYTLDNAQDEAGRVLFFGLISTENFNTVTFAFPGLAVDAYGLDDLIVADSGQFTSPAAVPVFEPVGLYPLEAALLFDDGFYLATNPDVAAAGLDPLGHYATFGWLEGRDPNAFFDTEGYLFAYPDVDAAGIDPLVHYALWGWLEGRDPSASFDTDAYLLAYPDVDAAGINPLEHYLYFGAAEGRLAFADGVFS